MRSLGVIGVAALASFSAAQASDCKLLRLFTSVTMQPWTGRIVIPAEINGVPKKMLFDTGGGISVISPQIVAEMNLAKRESDMRLFAVDGSVSHFQVRLDSLQVGAIQGHDINVMVAPGKDLDDGDIAGSIAPDLLQRYDVELDFATQKMNFISPDHCEGKVVYWPHGIVAMVPMTLDRENAIKIPVTINGHEFEATIDTGASDTVMNLRDAGLAFDLRPDSPGMNKVGILGDDPHSKMYTHVFDTLTFDGITVSHPRMTLMPDIVDKHDEPVTGSRLKDISDDVGLPSVIIGMGILSKLHIYFAFKERKLYITPADAPSAPPVR